MLVKYVCVVHWGEDAVSVWLRKEYFNRLSNHVGVLLKFFNWGKMCRLLGFFRRTSVNMPFPKLGIDECNMALRERLYVM